jgi:hypothetical protein
VARQRSIEGPDRVLNNFIPPVRPPLIGCLPILWTFLSGCLFLGSCLEFSAYRNISASLTYFHDPSAPTTTQWAHPPLTFHLFTGIPLPAISPYNEGLLYIPPNRTTKSILVLLGPMSHFLVTDRSGVKS